MTHIRYPEQLELDRTVLRLNREVSELRWALSTREDYESDIAWLEKRKAEYAARVAEDSE